MKFQEFISWMKQPHPKEVINEHLEDLAQLGRFPAFKLYLEIIRYRVHNLAERSIIRPKDARDNAKIIEGLRMILVDFKKIEKEFKQRNKE